jgi:uncharacterized damage-inducible protein DinB
MMTPDPEIAHHLRLLDHAYDRRSWHGPNLRGALRGLSAAQAAARPIAPRRSIAEQALHAAYWKYTVRRRLAGEKRGGFPLKGSNWFPVAADLDERGWRAILDLLESQHHALRAAVAAFDPARLDDHPPGSDLTWRDLIQGVAFHDVYHAGQIQGLRRLLPGPDDA